MKYVPNINRLRIFSCLDSSDNWYMIWMANNLDMLKYKKNANIYNKIAYLNKLTNFVCELPSQRGVYEQRN